MPTISSFKLEKIFLLLIEIGVYLSLLTPLIVINTYFFPFVVPKTIFFRSIVCLIFILYLLLAKLYPIYQPKFNSLTIALIVFLLVLFITSLTGVNFQRSFWSTFERMTGLFTLFHLFVFFLILTSVFKERKYWERILIFSLIVCLIETFYVFLNADNPTTRGGGTLGNSTFYSAYLLFNLFFSLILLTLKRNWWWRGFFILAFIIFLAGLFFNPGGFTKGAVSAFIFGSGFFLLFFLILYPLSPFKQKFKIIILPLIILLILAVIISFIQFDFIKAKFIKLYQSNSFQSRLIVWQIAYRAWQEKFWLGWGWENFNIPFIKYYQPKLPLTGDIWYDRVHNIVFDIAVSAGLAGLISYFTVFIIAIFSLVKFLKHKFSVSNLILSLLLITLLLVYVLQNIWAFDMISSYVMFFLSLAFISFLTSPQNDLTINLDKPKKEKSRTIFFSWPIITFLLFFVFLVFYLGNLQSARAAKLTVQAMNAPLEQSLVIFQKIFQISPMAKFEVPERMVNKMAQLIAKQDQNKDLLTKGFELAEQELKNSIKSDSMNYRLYLFLGKHYNLFYQLTRNVEKLNLAEETLLKAKELSPLNQQTYWYLAQTKIFRGEIEEAINLVNQAIDLEPKFLNSHLLAIQIAIQTRDYNLLNWQIQRALAINPNWQKEIKQVLSQE